MGGGQTVHGDPRCAVVTGVLGCERLLSEGSGGAADLIPNWLGVSTTLNLPVSSPPTSKSPGCRTSVPHGWAYRGVTPPTSTVARCK